MSVEMNLNWLPVDQQRRTTLLVLPGGSYAGHADHEAEPVADWLHTLGFHAAVLRYRVTPNLHPAPLDDALAALRQLRGRSDVSRLGVLGFSAGGHLAGCCCTADDRGDRPEFGVLCYPVVTMLGPNAHDGSRLNLLGADASEDELRRWSVEQRVDGDTPPMFVWHTAADEPVPPSHSLALATALAAHRVPFELHVFERGRHGVGLCDQTTPPPDDDQSRPPEVAQWTTACANWLSRR